MTDTLSYTPFYLYDTSGAAAVHEQQSFSFDSIFNLFQKSDTLVRESLFSEHLLPRTHLDALAHTSILPQSWVFGACVLLVLFVAIFFKSYRLKLVDVFVATVNTRIMTRIQRDNNMSHLKSWVPVGIIHSLAVSLVLYYYYEYAHLEYFVMHDVLLFLTFFAACVVGYFLRNLLFAVLGNVFEGRQVINQYLFSNYFWHLMECVLLLPIVVFLFYVPSVTFLITYLLCIGAGLCFFVRLFRNLQMVLTIPNASKFYLFYYLCIVELIPVAALVFIVVR
ncbi:MAG: DUF4271 domain-containing protein [Bacteroidales bacterium]|nr:DUF4271 domain-containing protein [Bacteroidales bacterium]